jgi:hypothetical protein
VKVSRRTFIAAGVLGAAALATAGWLRGPHAPASGVPRRALNGDGEALFAAVIPVLLAGALPRPADARREAVARTLTGVDIGVSGLPPAARDELRQLVALLALPPVRFGFARVSPSWNEAPTEEVRRFLDRCRDSSTTLLRAAYDALHQLTFAAWYGNPDSWPAIGYPGPPAIEAAS